MPSLCMEMYCRRILAFLQCDRKGISCYSVRMLQLRRILALCARIHTVLFLLFLFTLLLFFTQLWWDVTTTYAHLLYSMVLILARIGIGYAIAMLVLILLIWAKDKIFCGRPFTAILLRSVFFIVCALLVRLFTTVTSEGMVIHL